MINDINIKANQIIDVAIGDFLERVNAISENEPFRKARKMPTTFSMLKPANDEYYEYAFFERTLEWYIRDFLINAVFHGLFVAHEIDALWPEEKNYVRFSTEAIENIHPFEFIVTSEEEKVGVRYTGLCEGDAEELINKYEISRIIQIKWSDDVTSRDKETEDYAVVSPEMFFSRYFSQDEYSMFISKVMPAIEKANTEIGFETIPRLSLRYLSNFKAVINAELSNLKIENMLFQVLPESKCKEDLGLLCFEKDDYSIVRRNFIEKGLYKALLGNSKFAQCFITAEYQYHVFGDGNNFDYTSVVCGYLKSIEQLVYTLTTIRLHYHDGEDLWIKSRPLKKKQRERLADAIRQNPDPKSNATQILYKAEYEPYFDITLNPLIWFIHDDENGWCISKNGRVIIHKLLRNFADECRNDHFHKDNIDVYDVVTCIRNNTLLLAAVLLGGYKLTGNHQEDIALLGIADDTFDKIYKKIQELPKGISKFIVYFPATEPVKAYRHFHQEPTSYDEFGSVGSSKIRFVAVDTFSTDEYDKAMLGVYVDMEFTIARTNMPEKISYINGRNEEVFISW